MRVALLTHNAQAGDAIGHSVAAKAAFFRDRGAEVRVFVESDRRLHPALRPHCRVVPADPAAPWWRYASAADLLVGEFGQFYSALQLLTLLAGSRPRILLDYHGVTPPHLWGPHNPEVLRRGLEQRGLTWCADAVVVHSGHTECELRENCRLPPARLHRLGFPLDLERWSPGRGPGPLRRRWRLEGASVLLFVGRLAPNKRVPVLVEALARLRERTPPVHAVVVGDTGDLYREEARRCRELAGALGVADRLHLLGRLPEADLPGAYRAADVLVMPSVSEGFCIPVIEALASALPVVAAHATALPETVADAGLTFRPEDADDLAVQVGKILDTPELREELCRRGLERARLFSTENWSRQFARIVEGLLEAEPLPCRHRALVRARSRVRRVRAGADTTLVAVRVHNRGTHPLTAEGPGRTALSCRVVDARGRVIQTGTEDIPLPGLIQPGRSLQALLPVPVPAAPGLYQVELWAKVPGGEKVPCPCPLRLIVREGTGGPVPFLETVAGGLREANRLQQLPEDYVDVTEGLLAAVKCRLKKKLLGNFKAGYVDVLSRQQSAFNRQVLAVLQDLAECCATLEKAVHHLRRSGRASGRGVSPPVPPGPGAASPEGV